MFSGKRFCIKYELSILFTSGKAVYEIHPACKKYSSMLLYIKLLIAKALLQYETLNPEEVAAVIQEKSIEKHNSS
jgi:hypothetical protein